MPRRLVVADVWEQAVPSLGVGVINVGQPTLDTRYLMEKTAHFFNISDWSNTPRIQSLLFGDDEQDQTRLTESEPGSARRFHE
jgi:hypothetical protein